MKRALGISNRIKSELIQQQQKWYVKPKTTQKNLNRRFIGEPFIQSRSFCSKNDFPREITKLFTEKDPSTSYRFDEEPNFIFDVSKLRDKLLENASDLVKIEGILDSSYLFPRHGSSAFIELLNQLRSRPQLALQVFSWRFKKNHDGWAMETEEYAKGIMISGRVKDVDLAVELFMEAASMGRRTASTYNALMSAYLYNGLDWKCRKLFIEMKKEVVPTIVTYNILTSLYGRLCLVPYMERIFLEIKEANLSPNITTYNNLISGYVTAWQFDKMEWMYAFMEQGPVKPDIKTHLYMLRGYAHWKKVDKMESIYELVKDHVNEKDVVLVRTMIAAYCDSSDPDRVRKIEALMKIIPEEDYRAWLHVKLINVYAQENLIERMQSYINDAFNRNTRVVTKNVMLSIIATFFRCNAMEELAKFVKQAESARWRICRSLYHCKMVMCSSQNRLEEMEKVLEEMEQSNIDPSKKTFLIMYRAYTDYGHRTKVELVVGAMFKHGFEIPGDAFSS
ncbi:hypothetical protein MKW98_031470 [Papaver atlanticum]|uniref:Pentatricopeptide repeat-containing protein n=1 Tax=Papaver atlanticum TaxID=357466 RepID=A0AAD4S558_9MAGN|nr:hypothetical protein MKW98_031470 [Papaver atlanticum]